MTKEIIDNPLPLIQSEVNVAKSLKNNFGGYGYRNAEGILSIAKPINKKYGCYLISVDKIINVCDRIYVKTTSSLYDKNNNLLSSAVGIAREPLSKKGMDEAQITGSSASYSLKRALGNLYAISDSSLDPDATNKHGKDNIKPVKAMSVPRTDAFDDIL